jgi:exodeoxyribonuclease V
MLNRSFQTEQFNVHHMDVSAGHDQTYLIRLSVIKMGCVTGVTCLLTKITMLSKERLKSGVRYIRLSNTSSISLKAVETILAIYVFPTLNAINRDQTTPSHAYRQRFPQQFRNINQMPELTPEQQAVEAQVDAFIHRRQTERDYFTFQGQAGVGKTVLLAHLARKYTGAMLCAFTGKAASVISRKSGLHAVTIHSALYRPYEDPETRELKFSRTVEDGEWFGNLVFVDEASTVSQWLAKDLLATGCKVVACGDDGQLPPVKGVSFFTADGAADATLHEIHRQAWDSAIIRQAHAVRSGGGYQNDGPDFQIKRDISRDDLLAADVVLCYRNATRVGLNRLIRAHKGYGGIGLRGESVMALRNSPEWGILNGGVYTLLENHINGSGVVVIVNERGEEIAVEKAWIEDFEGAPLVEESNPFAWSYCATVHKYQGSEATRVILVDEYDKQDQRARWLYTGITRASKSIIVQRFW